MHKEVILKTPVMPDLKTKVEDVLKQLGLSTTEAIVLFFHQVKLHRDLPFDIKIPREAKIPNETTLKTFRDTDAGRNLVEHDNLDAMFADLKS